MLRWILQDHDHISVFRHYAVNEAVVHAQLSQIHFEQPFWFYVTDQAFRTFFNRDYLRPEDLQSEQLKIWQTEMQRVAIPHEMKTQIRKVLIDEGVSTKKFSVRLSCDLIKGAMPSKLLYDYCEMTAYGAEGIFQAIKASWVSLLNKGFMTALWNSGLTLADLKVGILITAQSEIKDEGRVYSVSPKCLWDRRHLVLTMTKLQPAKDYIEALSESGEHAYLVDRETLTVTYYGRNILGEKTKSRTSAPIDYELVKRVAKQFIQAEKIAGQPMIGDWTTTPEGQIYFNRWNHYNEVPSASFYQENLNSPSRHFWYLMQWSQNGELCTPFWFSLMVKHFRTATLKMLGQTSAKQHLPASYERVLRQTLGILRGRAYLNLGALHRLLYLAPYDSMFNEINNVLGSWQKRFDKELRVFWEGPWPDLPKLKVSDKKRIRTNYKRTLKSVKNNTESFFLQFEYEMQALYDLKWDQRNLSESFQEIRDLESRMVKIFSPALFLELEYWSMKSYCHKMSANSGDFSWLEDEDREFIPIEGNWLSRRRQRLLNDKWDDIKKSRKKVHRSLFKYFDLLKKRLEVLASKFVALGILKKASDLFYLTLDEILSFEEGRLMTINLQTLVQNRIEEYRTYAADEKIPQIWLTIGLVGLAEKYQSVISIKDLKHDWTPIVEDLIETEFSVTTEVPRDLPTDAGLTVNELSVASNADAEVKVDVKVDKAAKVEADVEVKTALNKDNTPIALANSDINQDEELLDLPTEDNFVKNLFTNNARESVSEAQVIAQSEVEGTSRSIADVSTAAAALIPQTSKILTNVNTPADQIKEFDLGNEAKDEDIFQEVSIRNIQM
jgi:hypothetical protein